MEDSFSYFEQGIERMARRVEGMPVDHVVLKRLFVFTYQQMQESYNAFLSQFGLNDNTFLALVLIYNNPEGQLNPCELSNRLISSRANVTRFTDELVTAGWVERKVSTEDRRRVELFLTLAGLALVESVLPKVWERLVRQWGVLDEGEMKELNRLLRKLLAGQAQMEQA